MEIKYVKLGEQCSKIGSGATPKGGSSVYIDSGVSLIRSQNVYNLHFSYSGLAHICDSAANKLKSVTVKKDDVLLNITGDSVARTCVVPDNVLPARVNQHVAIVRPNNDVDSRYLNYYLASPAMQGYLLNIASTGASRNAITKAMIEKLIIPIPALPIQRRIASILSAYDNLIENNNRRIRLLEQMAENLYKEWFVRFRFPGHEKVEMENGLPKGWKKASLGEICQFKRGKNITSDEMCVGNIPVISAGIEASGFHNRSNVKGVSVTMSSSGANAGFLSIHYSDIWAADCSYIEESSTANIYYVYELLNNIRTIITNFQRGAAQPHVYPKDINRIKLIVPDKNLMRKANEKLLSMHKAIDTLQQQNQLLTRQRDLLIPRLMSGKLEVNA